MQDFYFKCVFKLSIYQRKLILASMVFFRIVYLLEKKILQINNIVNISICFNFSNTKAKKIQLN